MKIYGKKIRNLNESGFSLIELVIVLVAVSILAGMAIQSMSALMSDMRQVKTEQELEDLADAIVGNPKITGGGGRIDFGYVGDIGAFPSSLDDLKDNPGGFSTWDGPYIKTGFANDTDGFKNDEWGSPYNYTGGITITSVGSGSTISKKIADASSDYLLNSFNGTVKDASDSEPGAVYMDSIDIKVSIPNGIGGTRTKSYQCNSSGLFSLDSLPVGQHPLRIIYTPNVDTLFSYLTILPRHKSGGVYKFASSYFSSGPSSSSMILRPDGVGSLTELLAENCPNGWQCVNEVTSDGDGTYVKGYGSQWKYDLYTVEDPDTASGIIDSVIVHVSAKGGIGGMKTRTSHKSNGSNHYGGARNTTASYVTNSTTYVANPSTGAAWTWTEINELEIGPGIKKEAFVTQVWVEVFYAE